MSASCRVRMSSRWSSWETCTWTRESWTTTPRAGTIYSRCCRTRSSGASALGSCRWATWASPRRASRRRPSSSPGRAGATRWRPTTSAHLACRTRWSAATTIWRASTSSGRMRRTWKPSAASTASQRRILCGRSPTRRCWSGSPRLSSARPDTPRTRLASTTRSSAGLQSLWLPSLPTRAGGSSSSRMRRRWDPGCGCCRRTMWSMAAAGSTTRAGRTLTRAPHASSSRSCGSTAASRAGSRATSTCRTTTRTRSPSPAATTAARVSSPRWAA
mmetsp:Transcript_27321/g.86820  ORF Transcript_27321/g.86820 Transcript_27321/m.86820 type:complete len:273 (-) Transcript_27321:1146-1964(-)